jgi:hypothetical protein
MKYHVGIDLDTYEIFIHIHIFSGQQINKSLKRGKEKRKRRKRIE